MSSNANTDRIARLADMLADQCDEAEHYLTRLRGAAEIMREWPERQASERRHIANAQNQHRDATVVLANMTNLLCCLRGEIDTAKALAKSEQVTA